MIYSSQNIIGLLNIPLRWIGSQAHRGKYHSISSPRSIFHLNSSQQWNTPKEQASNDKLKERPCTEYRSQESLRTPSYRLRIIQSGIRLEGEDVCLRAHLCRGPIHDIQVVTTLVIYDPRMITGNGRIDSHHGSVRLVREGNCIRLFTPKCCPFLAHRETSSLCDPGRRRQWNKMRGRITRSHIRTEANPHVMLSAA